MMAMEWVCFMWFSKCKGVLRCSSPMGVFSGAKDAGFFFPSTVWISLLPCCCCVLLPVAPWPIVAHTPPLLPCSPLYRLPPTLFAMSVAAASVPAPVASWLAQARLRVGTLGYAGWESGPAAATISVRGPSEPPSFRWWITLSCSFIP